MIPSFLRLPFSVLMLVFGLTAQGCSTFERLNPLAKKGPQASECSNDQPYRDTASVSPLHPARGVEPPVSQAALRIPDPVVNPVPFKQPVVENGVAGTRCLDQPPPMAPPTNIRLTAPGGLVPVSPVPSAGSAAAAVVPGSK